MRKYLLPAALLAVLMLCGCGSAAKKAAAVPTEAPVPAIEAVITPIPEPAAEPASTPVQSAAGIRPEFKATMDEYEKFFDEYCIFMKKYQENPTDMQMLAQYASLMTQYTETMNALENLDTSDLSDEENLYYTQVLLRIDSKLLEAVS